MCRQGEHRKVKIGGRLFLIDKCLVDIVWRLNAMGKFTNACCCGHGEKPAVIVLDDGRALVVYEKDKMPDNIREQYDKVKLK